MKILCCMSKEKIEKTGQLDHPPSSWVWGLKMMKIGIHFFIKVEVKDISFPTKLLA